MALIFWSSTLERAVKLLKDRATAGELYFLAMSRHRLGEPVNAKHDLDEAVRWQESAKLSPEQREEFQSFRTEAEAVLKETMRP